MEPDNYGVERGRSGVAATGGLSAGDERTWAALAHLSTYLNLFTGFVGPVAAFVVWLLYRERSGYVAHHALRSVVYQVIWLAVLSGGWTVTIVLIPFVVGLVLLPVMVLLTLGFLAHPAFEAYGAYRGPHQGF